MNSTNTLSPMLLGASATSRLPSAALLRRRNEARSILALLTPEGAEKVGLSFADAYELVYGLNLSDRLSDLIQQYGTAAADGSLSWELGDTWTPAALAAALPVR